MPKPKLSEAELYPILNSYKVEIMPLRMFLASLSSEGDVEIPLAALIFAAKEYSRKENKRIAIAS